MKRTSIISTLIASAFALPLAAHALGDKPRAKTAATTDSSVAANTQGGSADAFRTADKNADGFISMEEARDTAHSANFATLDKNGDGKLSQVEFAASKDYTATQPGSKADSVTTSTPAGTSVKN